MAPTAGLSRPLVAGASHRTASSAMLAEFGRAAEAFRADVRNGRNGGSRLPVEELALLSTCARVEVYAVSQESSADEALRLMGREIFGSEASFQPGGCGYRFRGPDAVRHVCRVASGLESFVLGEHEIAGQVARAFKDALYVRGESNVLGLIAGAARRASRRVRSETGIGRHAASVSSVSVNFVRERLGDIRRSRVVVVGAGRAGSLVARAMRSSGVQSLTIVNRSVARARELAAEVGGDAAELGRLPQLLTVADVVVTATGAEEIIIDEPTARDALAARAPDRHPLLLLDLALPGDVAPGAGTLPGLELLTLDDVRNRVHEHLAFRRQELGAAEQVVGEIVEDFVRQQESPEIGAAIDELRRSVEAVRSAEVERWLESRGSDRPPAREELDQLTRSIVNKLLHDPMRRLRDAPPRSGKSRWLVRAARELSGAGKPDGPTTTG